MTTPIQISDKLTVHHVGPAFEQGPLPTIFYLSLSATDSLNLDPFNQPVQALAGEKVRFFSLDLPAHENNRSPHEALKGWANEIAQGIDPFTPFFGQVLEAVEYGIANHLIDPQKLGIAGLSRGGFLALHLAAREPRFKAVVTFAPLTDLTASKDLQQVSTHPLLAKFKLETLKEKLADKTIRFTIGNKDTRVGTKACVDFALALVEKSTLRFPQIELIITPSIGQMGHGTAPETFYQGAKWLYQALT